MQRIVSRGDVAGMTWLLAKDGEVAAFNSAGFASLEDGIPMEKDTLFRIYSMTKPITGVAMMILHEQGLWDFDDPVSKFIPEFENLQVLSSNDANGTLEPLNRQPTMRELMNHTAGFGYGLRSGDPVNDEFSAKEVLNSSDLEELTARVATIPLLSQPGELWSYSIAVDLQSRIVEILSGMSYGQFLEQKIFGPLGMDDTSFFVSEADRERFADVYHWDSEQGKLVRNSERPDRPGYFDPDRLESGGGGLVSSTHDYARFLQMMVNGGELDGARIISEESVTTMRTDSLPEGVSLRSTSTGRVEPGRGFGVDFAVINDPEAAGTPQGTGTYYWGGAAGTWFWIDPENDMFFIGMIQARGATRPGNADMRNIALDMIYSGL
ncbi:MAG: serine hydrolase domain-containing protein [Pseudohongiellaceae bacterium]|nr:serine hydrolase domain-containing protein [Pseudohongiellaceae bacterium]